VPKIVTRNLFPTAKLCYESILDLENLIAIHLVLDKLAKMSSVYDQHSLPFNFEAASAVDGFYKLVDSRYSLAHSLGETRPWWRVDLGDVHCVWAVFVLNRYESK